MFTGIIEGVGRLAAREPRGGDVRFSFATGSLPFEHVQLGESIAVNGVCLTVVAFDAGSFQADASTETLALTTLGTLAEGAALNLERAMRPSDRLGGHLVSGHVDAQGRVEERRSTGDFTLFTFSLDPGLTRYIIEKGSIAIDGVSLTVNSCERGRFAVSIIPHTLQVTMLGRLKPGDLVNIEVDMIGKYVEKMLAEKPAGIPAAGRINPGFLAEHGFL